MTSPQRFLSLLTTTAAVAVAAAGVCLSAAASGPVPAPSMAAAPAAYTCVTIPAQIILGRQILPAQQHCIPS